MCKIKQDIADLKINMSTEVVFENLSRVEVKYDCCDELDLVFELTLIDRTQNEDKAVTINLSHEDMSNIIKNFSTLLEYTS